MMQGKEDWNQKLVAVAIDKDNGSQHALKWALQRLVTKGQTMLLTHVSTNATPIPSSIGNQASEAKEEANSRALKSGSGKNGVKPCLTNI